MTFARKVLVLCVMAALATGCATTGKVTMQAAAPVNSALELEKKNIEMLTGYIEVMKEQAVRLQNVLGPEDPLIVQINATDLAGMNLRVELMSLVLDHCLFSKAKLEEAAAHPERKPQLLEEFIQHRKQTLLQLEAIDLQRDQQERKRMELGMKLIQDALK